MSAIYSTVITVIYVKLIISFIGLLPYDSVFLLTMQKAGVFVHSNFDVNAKQSA